jgi:hypothetical protein
MQHPQSSGCSGGRSREAEVVRETSVSLDDAPIHVLEAFDRLDDLTAAGAMGAETGR